MPEDVDSSEEELFRQQIRDLAFTVIMQQIIHFIGHHETISSHPTDRIVLWPLQWSIFSINVSI